MNIAAAFFVPFLIATIFLAVSADSTFGKRTPERPNVQIPPDWKNLLTEDVYNYHLNKESNSNSLFESDIAGIEQATDSTATSAVDRKGHRLRTAIENKNMLWPNGVVPYEISNSFTSSERRIMEEALEDMMRKTCIRFVPFAQQTDYISFVRRGLGCSSYVARTGGKQLIDLQPGCVYQIGEVQHEVMHALGFLHEQSRTDRDQYVTIIWNNISPGAESQFQTYRTDNLNMPYDYESIMHYGWNYFAKDAKNPTILPKVKAALGSRKVMSRWDVEKINRLYQCPALSTPVVTRPTMATRSTTAAPRPSTRSFVTVSSQHVQHSTKPGRMSWEDFKKSVKISRSQK